MENEIDHQCPYPDHICKAIFEEHSRVVKEIEKLEELVEKLGVVIENLQVRSCSPNHGEREAAELYRAWKKESNGRSKNI